MMDEEDFCYCHYDYEDEEHDCLDYMECEQCPYYYADLDDLEVQIMTIDEAIKHAREVAKNKMAEYQNHYDKDAHYYPRQCKKCAEEHEQLSEWLEELKAYREIGTVEECRNSISDIDRTYNKGIDDFVNFASTLPTVEEKDGTIRPMWLKEIAEQLKAGAKNE